MFVKSLFDDPRLLIFVLLLCLLKLCLMTLVWLYLQDPGWLMGVRKINNQKGVFPENFTKPV